jgi:DNA polymerase-3 subunit delta'
MDLSGLPGVSAPLPWQAATWTRLSQQLQGEQLPHALLLVGAKHTGKARLALALARLLLCHAPSGGLNCAHCHACELSASGSHGDFRWLQPLEKSRVIKIDQVRDVVEFANKTAGLGRRKVIVLAPADSMNSNAANALLKSLEEPAPHTYLVLTCHQLYGVPATIRSRCQILKLPSPERDQCLAWLDQLTGQRDESERLLSLADGLPLLAEAMYREAGAESVASAREALHGLFEGRTTASQLVDLLGDNPTEEVLAQLTTGLQTLLRSMDGERLACPQGRAVFGLLDEVTRIRAVVNAGANPNQQLLLESLLGKIQRELGGRAS